jgi:hypothetical protein
MVIKMSSKRKYETIKLNTRKPWETPMGHHNHLSGSGTHNTKPKRLRTRNAIDKQWRKEYDM